MSYANFNEWMKTKRNLDVLIMDGGQIIAEVKKAKVMVGVDRNQNGYPVEFTVLKNGTTINIGSRYINHVVETGEYWSIFVDGYEHYLLS